MSLIEHNTEWRTFLILLDTICVTYIAYISLFSLLFVKMVSKLFLSKYSVVNIFQVYLKTSTESVACFYIFEVIYFLHCGIFTHFRSYVFICFQIYVNKTILHRLGTKNLIGKNSTKHIGWNLFKKYEYASHSHIF